MRISHEPKRTKSIHERASSNSSDDSPGKADFTYEVMPVRFSERNGWFAEAVTVKVKFLHRIALIRRPAAVSGSARTDRTGWRADHNEYPVTFFRAFHIT